MEKISKNFYRSESACKCGCGFAVVDLELNSILEDLRAYFDNTSLAYGIEITSGCRCFYHNEKIQREKPGYKNWSSKSYHMKGMANDIKVWAKWGEKQLNPNAIYNYLNSKYSNKYGLGKYKTFTHIDVGPFRRW